MSARWSNGHSSPWNERNSHTGKLKREVDLASQSAKPYSAQKFYQGINKNGLLDLDCMKCCRLGCSSIPLRTTHVTLTSLPVLNQGGAPGLHWLQLCRSMCSPEFFSLLRCSPALHPDSWSLATGRKGASGPASAEATARGVSLDRKFAAFSETSRSQHVWLPPSIVRTREDCASSLGVHRPQRASTNPQVSFARFRSLQSLLESTQHECRARILSRPSQARVHPTPLQVKPDHHRLPGDIPLLLDFNSRTHPSLEQRLCSLHLALQKNANFPM